MHICKKILTYKKTGACLFVVDVCKFQTIRMEKIMYIGSDETQASLDEIATPILTLSCERGNYEEIVKMCGYGAIQPVELLKRYEMAFPETGIERYPLSGRARRLHGKFGWTAVNASVYGYDPLQNVGIFQIRQSGTGEYGIEVKKDYVLAGLNEDGSTFRHPVSSNAVRGAIRMEAVDPAFVVKKAQCWMWQCTMRQLELALANGCRQGDVIMIKIPRPHNLRQIENRIVNIGGSHELKSNSLFECDEIENSIISLNPFLLHLNNQHAPVFAPDEGYYSVRLAREANAWKFGERIGD